MKLIRFASCGLLLIGLAFCVGCVTSETDATAYTPPPPNVDDASETLQNQLFASVPFLAKQQIYLVPKTTHDAFYQIMLFLNAGMQSEALAALDRLQSLQPELCMEDAFGIFKKATACAAWDVAQQIVERYGDRNAWIGLGELRAHWQHLCWNDAQVDAWLAAKAPGTNNFWIETRVHFLAASTKGDQLVAELEKKAQQHPRDMGATFLFFNALDALQDDCPSKTNRWDLSWMTQVLRPTKSSEAAAIADMLAYHQNTKAAEFFYTRAMRIKLSADEVKEQTGIQDKRNPDEIRAAWAVRLRMNLTEVLLDLQRPQEAHQLMSETEAIRQQYQLEPDLVRIGKLEAACKLHDYADKLKQEEPVCGQAPQYWKKLVEYYRGRQDTVQEEEALKRGLALTTPVDKASPEVYSNPRLEDHHCWFMREYLTFLERTKRTNAACALAYRMLATAPPESESACWAAYQVSEHLQLNPAYEEMLWRWLGAQPHLAEWTLERLLKAAPKDKQESYLRRAAQLVRQSHMASAACFGHVLTEMGLFKEALPWLRESITDRSIYWSSDREAVTDLFNVYLALLDWRHAEELLPSIVRDLGGNPAKLMARIAATAAKAEAKADAVRLWRQVINLCPMEFEHLDELVQSGLRDELVRLYRDLARQMSNSQAPSCALKLLHAN